MSTSTKTELTLDDTGVWKVFTEASAYILDITNLTGRRIPGEGKGAAAPGYPITVTKFVDDSEWFFIENLRPCKVGERMLIDRSGYPAWIMSTVVREIVPIDAGEYGYKQD